MQSEILVTFLPAAAIVVSGCSLLLKEPEIPVTGASLRSASLMRPCLAVMLALCNPDAVEITLPTLLLRCLYQGGEGGIPRAGGRERNHNETGHQCGDHPVSGENPALVGSLVDFLLEGEIAVERKGIVIPDFRVFAPSIPFFRTMTISP